MYTKKKKKNKEKYYLQLGIKIKYCKLLLGDGFICT